MTVTTDTVKTMTRSTDDLIKDIKFLLSFAPEDDLVPLGLPPEFYMTLTAEGDQKIVDRIQAIKRKVHHVENTTH